MQYPKDFPTDHKPFYAAAVQQGWTVTRNNKNRFKWVKQGHAPVFTSNSSDTKGTAIHDVRRRLRQAGVKI